MTDGKSWIMTTRKNWIVVTEETKRYRGEWLTYLREGVTSERLFFTQGEGALVTLSTRFNDADNNFVLVNDKPEMCCLGVACMVPTTLPNTEIENSYYSGAHINAQAQEVRDYAKSLVEIIARSEPVDEDTTTLAEGGSFDHAGYKYVKLNAGLSNKTIARLAAMNDGGTRGNTSGMGYPKPFTAKRSHKFIARFLEILWAAQEQGMEWNALRHSWTSIEYGQ